MRVVGLTADPSLTVALSMMGDWEVLAARDADEAALLAADAAVVVVGMGGTDEGLSVVEAIFNKGVTIPFVVVGDDAPSAGARAPVVLRPFSLDDLQYAVDEAISSGGYVPPAPVEPSAPSPEPDARHEPRFHVVGSEPDDEPGAGTDDVVSLEEVAAPTPADPSQGRGSAPTQEPARPAASVATQEARAAGTTLPPIPKEAVVGPRQDAPAQPPAAPARPAEPVRPSASAPPAAMLPSVVQPAKRRFGRRAGKPAAPASESDSPIDRKLRAGARAAQDLEALLAELPMLNDLGSMAEALLNEIVQLFQPETAAIYLRTANTFRVTASHGLSKVEQGLVVPENHALFGELMKAPEAVLIAPVDLAQGLVAGIGGARTEAMLAAPVAVEGRTIAIIVAGRHDFSDFDLEVIDDLAREAAPGLAVARLLDRLRAR